MEEEKLFSKLKAKSILIKAAALALTLLIGILIGFIQRDMLAEYEKRTFKHFEIRTGGYKFINPLLECRSASDASENRELKPFKHKIEQFVKNKLDNKTISDLAIYFRDLNNGPWFSIGPTTDFSPASLLKVPLMIAILKEAEQNPKILTRKVEYRFTQDLNSLQYYKPSKRLEYGKSYTVEDLLYRMIAYSDNNASALLESIVDIGMLKKTYNDLGIESAYKTKNYFLSAEVYASFFRILFNASYLNKHLSEKAMEYLVNAEFKDGLVGGIPSDIMVAHKFGEWEVSENKTKQLHDCGIVYYPNRPYLLCVMTMGDSYDYLDDTIRETSLLVYEEIDRQH